MPSPALALLALKGWDGEHPILSRARPGRVSGGQHRSGLPLSYGSGLPVFLLPGAFLLLSGSACGATAHDAFMTLPSYTRTRMLQIACCSKLFHHCSILLQVRAGKHLRSQGLGYVKGITIAICLKQSGPGVSLLRRVRHSSLFLRRFPVPYLSSMTPRRLCMSMRARWL